MTSTLNPYLSFTDRAREALEFYASVLGGEPQIMTFGDYQLPDAPVDGVMHGYLKTADGFELMASDSFGGEKPAGNNVHIALMGDDAEKLRGYYDKLSEGGSVTMPLGMQMWGDEYGAFVDRFGISWMVDIGVESPQP